MTADKKLSTESYKGVRDFYPEDQVIQNHIFSIWKKTVKQFGYQEYNASILESSELYKAKSGEEIVNEQTYTFKDRGDRDVTLRPEMTPTLARLVAARKRELAFPLRWFSIPNLFRYEQPQRGRLREHWQLNVDIFGVESIQAEVEILQIAYHIMRAYGLKDTDFELRLNSRLIMNYIFHDLLSLNEDSSYKLSKLIDKKHKISLTLFQELASDLVGDKLQFFLTLMNSKNFEEFTANLPQSTEEHKGLADVKAVIETLESLGITNVSFDQTIMRGFDYYTGIVFEVYDKNPENRRALFGGGRYDDLLSIFGSEKIAAVGFGAGDVTARDILETYNLLPPTVSDTVLTICPTDTSSVPYAIKLAQHLREAGISVTVDFTEKKVGDKIKTAVKQNVQFLVCIGSEEMVSKKFKVKNLMTREETVATEETIISMLQK